MDLQIVMADLFPEENVSPDMSSYEAIKKNWRGSGTIPTEAECQTAWEQADKDMYEQKRKAEYNKQGVTLEAMVFAMWEQFKENKSKAADDLQIIREQVKTDIPKPL